MAIVNSYISHYQRVILVITNDGPPVPIFQLPPPGPSCRAVPCRGAFPLHREGVGGEGRGQFLQARLHLGWRVQRAILPYRCRGGMGCNVVGQGVRVLVVNDGEGMVYVLGIWEGVDEFGWYLGHIQSLDF